MHAAVLLSETIESLQLKRDGTYVDCTFGRGGHTRAVLEHLGDGGRVVAIDRDPSAIAAGRDSLNDPRLELVHAPFSRLDEILGSRHLREQVDGILMDLGVSSPQLDEPERGFSFRADGPLDMRMDTTCGPTAAQWIAGVSEKEMRECFWELGEERFARRIAKRIVDTRTTKAIESTTQLATLIRQAVPGSNARIDPATRTFQAIRLRVNSELDELAQGLRVACECIAVGGRVVVVAFHSLEDRIVKRFFRDSARSPGMPSQELPQSQFQVLTKKPLRPSVEEIERNPRARSARLRVLERVA